MFCFYLNTICGIFATKQDKVILSLEMRAYAVAGLKYTVIFLWVWPHYFYFSLQLGYHDIFENSNNFAVVVYIENTP